jgi:hypothetical protein
VTLGAHSSVKVGLGFSKPPARFGCLKESFNCSRLC